ncbi:MAG: tol-pal system protein YbgF [Nitrospirae bacterium]|nr:tol-pal system protein YbgF [Nitrospirota bacterium]MBI3604473.1 tol-pal system protein YbgF [Nitrospirota bacterium]
MIRTETHFLKLWLTGSVYLVLTGCAFQSDLTDLHIEMDEIKDKMAQMTLKTDATDRISRERTQSTSNEQGNAFLKVDQMAVDLQTIQGRLEENNHSIGDLSQKIEEQTLRMHDQNSRLGNLENQMVSLEKSGQNAQAPPPQSSAEQGKMILPGQVPPSSLMPQEAYNQAYNDFVKGNYDLALIGFQNFIQQFPASALIPNAYYWMGESNYSKKEYLKAVENFDKVGRDYPKHDKTPSSILKEGYAYLEMGEKLRGKSYLKKVIELFPRSDEARLAKERLSLVK